MHDRFNLATFGFSGAVHGRSFSEFMPRSIASKDIADTRENFSGSLLVSDNFGFSLASDSYSGADISGSSSDSADFCSDGLESDIPSSETASEIEGDIAPPSETNFVSDVETEVSSLAEMDTELETDTASKMESVFETESVETEIEPDTEMETLDSSFSSDTVLSSDILSDAVFDTESVVLLQSIDSGIQAISFTLSGLFFVVMFDIFVNYSRRIVRRFLTGKGQ